MVLPHPRDAEPQLAVVEQQAGADLRRLMISGWAAAPAAHRPDGAEVEAEGLARLKLHAAALEAPDPQLRPLHIGEDADRPAHLPLQCADDGDALGMVGVGPWEKFSRNTSAPAR
jgi:hypothetical protein